MNGQRSHNAVNELTGRDTESNLPFFDPIRPATIGRFGEPGFVPSKNPHNYVGIDHD
jgi:hypothetical protein